MQFHPTALAVAGAPRFLLSEALRGEGGILRNIHLERFMKRYAEAQELAPRDVVARAIVSEMQRTESAHVYLDMTAKSEAYLKKRFPRIFETCLSYGLNLAADMAPVCPAAHYMMGGVQTDLWGRTSLRGLYAAGETADTGVHGANRLASNSLLEGLVFGARSGQAMISDAPAAKHKSGSTSKLPAAAPVSAASSKPPKPVLKHGPAFAKIRDLMWRYVGILRNGKELQKAIQQFQALDLPRTEAPERAEYEVRNLHSLALLMARSALAREESRGSHYRSDFPYLDDDKFKKHSFVERDKDVTFAE
jgi:L-aspartate oxidase